MRALVALCLPLTLIACVAAAGPDKTGSDMPMSGPGHAATHEAPGTPGSAQIHPASPAAPDMKTQLLAAIGDDLAALDEDSAIEELNKLARYALETERPDLFRTVMVAHVDPHWDGLSDARTALNMIAWLPDTADYLSARIAAARFSISAEELPDIESQRLWRDLRARVERVGDPQLLLDLTCAMMASQSDALLIETIERFHATDRDRLRAFVALLESEELDPARPISQTLHEKVEALLAADASGASNAGGNIPLAYWKSGHPERAVEIISSIPDPVSRLEDWIELYRLHP